jgi:hypothetical protein
MNADWNVQIKIQIESFQKAMLANFYFSPDQALN